MTGKMPGAASILKGNFCFEKGCRKAKVLAWKKYKKLTADWQLASFRKAPNQDLNLCAFKAPFFE